MKNLVVIPTSRFVEPEMQLEVGKIPPALIQVRGKPLYHAIAESYSAYSGTFEFALLVNEGAGDVKQQSKQGIPVQIVQIQLQPDLGGAILDGLTNLDLTDCDSLFINFGDTVVNAPCDMAHDAVFYDHCAESFRWTTFTQSGGKISSITDKEIADEFTLHHVFTGVFLIKDPHAFKESLERARQHGNPGRFYSALLDYLSHRDYRLIKVKEWQDFGHVDNYYQERKRGVNKRFFNQVIIEASKPLLRKTSANFEKFEGEINWYLELPPGLKCYAPQVFDHALAGRDSFLEMEFYGYPSLAELFLSSGRSLGIWNHVFDGIFGVLQEMRAYRLPVSRAEVHATFHEMYISKTIERLETLRAHPIFQGFFQHDIRINEGLYPSLDAICADLRTSLERFLPYDDAWSVIHGDLCLSNILFDPRHRIIKLIDPRGKFGARTVHGDYRYDLAKLSHSFNGNYEAIIHDRFFALYEDGSLTFQASLSPYQSRVTELFNRRMKNEHAQHIPAVQQIESLLFLSMIPLHSDHLNRQIAMLATGVQKYSAANRMLELHP